MTVDRGREQLGYADGRTDKVVRLHVRLPLAPVLPDLFEGD